MQRRGFPPTRKAPGEEQRRCFGHDHNALANLAPEEIGSGRLATTGAAREHDPASHRWCRHLHLP
jgi:hypothetical protein